MIPINERISYFPAIESPLAADTGVIRGDQYLWLFDLGPNEAILVDLLTQEKPLCLALSHFHQDHMAYWNRLPLQDLYVGKHTFKYTHCGSMVDSDLYVEDGVKLHFLPLPSTHAKGCIGLEVDGTYAFLGDGTYPMQKDGQSVYNANLLSDTLRVLRSLKAPYFLLSHDEQYVWRREEVLAELEAVYARRQSNSMYIEV